MTKDRILRTSRLTLRPLEEGDEHILWPYVRLSTISHFMAWEPHQSIGETRYFVEMEIARAASGRGMTWALFLDRSFCGIASLIAVMRHHRAITYDKAELAYWLTPESQGKGLMTEALRSIIEYGFAELELHKICVSHVAENAPSRKVIERLGFRYIGTQVSEFKKGDIWYDHLLYERLRGDA